MNVDGTAEQKKTYYAVFIAIGIVSIIRTMKLFLKQRMLRRRSIKP